MFTSLFLIALAVLPSTVLAAPIPHRSLLSRSPKIEPRDSDITGWPQSTNLEKEKTAFGVSGNFESKYLTTFQDQPALVADYPEGSYAGAKPPPDGPGIAGFIFQATGNVNLKLAEKEKLQFSYDVFFPPNFRWEEGGKLPGLSGGTDAEVAKTCSGGRHNDTCWSARIMWRASGAGELYAYLPTANKDKPICKGNGVDCSATYGASIDRGNWHFKAGEWTTIMEEVTVGEGTGSITVYVNGEKTIGPYTELTLPGEIRGAMMHTFFGGSTDDKFESPENQKAYFRNFSFKTVSSES